MLPLKRKQQKVDERKTKIMKLYTEPSSFSKDSAPALSPDSKLFFSLSNMKKFEADFDTRITTLFEFISIKANKAILSFIKNEECNSLNSMESKKFSQSVICAISFPEILKKFSNCLSLTKDLKNDISCAKILEFDRKLQKYIKLMNENYEKRCKSEKLFFKLPSYLQNCIKDGLKTRKYSDNFVYISNNMGSFCQTEFDSNGFFFSSIWNDLFVNNEEKNALLINNFKNFVSSTWSHLNEETKSFYENAIADAKANELLQDMQQIFVKICEKDGIFFTAKNDNISFQNFILGWMFKVEVDSADGKLEEHKAYENIATAKSLTIHIPIDAFDYLYFWIESPLSSEYDHTNRNIFCEKIAKSFFSSIDRNLTGKFILEKKCNIAKQDLLRRNWFSGCEKSVNQIRTKNKINFNLCSDLQNDFNEIALQNPIDRFKDIANTDLNTREKKNLLNSIKRFSSCSNTSKQEICCTTIENKSIINLRKIRKLLLNIQTINIGTYEEDTSYFIQTPYNSVYEKAVHEKFKNGARNNCNEFGSEMPKAKYCSSVIEDDGALITELIPVPKDHNTFFEKKLQNFHKKQHYYKNYLEDLDINLGEKENFENLCLEESYLSLNVNKKITSFEAKKVEKTTSGIEILPSEILADDSRKSDSTKFEFSNNQIISVEYMKFSSNEVNNFNPESKILTTDFDFLQDNKKSSKHLNLCELNGFPSSSNKETSEIVLNVYDTEKKNAACQTENSIEKFENYFDLSNLILKLKSCDSTSITEREDEVAIRNVNCSSAHMLGSQLENELIQLKQKKLFVSTESTSFPHELTSFKDVAYGEFSNSKGDSFSTVPEETNLYQSVADDESFYLNNEDTVEVETGGSVSKMENVNKHSIQRSKVRMGLSRKQKVKPLHPYFNYKEASS